MVNKNIDTVYVIKCRNVIYLLFALFNLKRNFIYLNGAFNNNSLISLQRYMRKKSTSEFWISKIANESRFYCSGNAGVKSGYYLRQHVSRAKRYTTKTQESRSSAEIYTEEG